MIKSILASVFLVCIAIASSSARTPLQTPVQTRVPTQRLDCSCSSDFTCLFEAFGCPGFACERIHGPFGGGVCAPIER